MADFQQNLVESEEAVAEICRSAKRVAVLGIKTEEQAGQAAFYVPQYLASAGLEVVPVPVYYPEVTTILGQKVYRKLADVPGDIDIVDVFRRSNDVLPHVDDILAKRPLPKVVWLQSGIRNAEAAERLARAGIKVVQDRCLMVDHRHYARR